MGYLTSVWLPNTFFSFILHFFYIVAMLFYFFPTQSKPTLMHLFSKLTDFHMCSSIIKLSSLFLFA